MSALLTSDEIRELTGYKRPKDQIRRLRERAIPHEVNALGRPVVPRDWMNKRIGVVAEKQLGRVA